MSFDAFMDFLQHFETRRVVSTLEELNLQELIRNPYFLGGTAALSIVAFFMRWRLLLVVILTIAGFVGLLAYTFERGTSLEGGLTNDALLIFVAGGTLIVFLVIYMLFIRGD